MRGTADREEGAATAASQSGGRAALCEVTLLDTQVKEASEIEIGIDGALISNESVRNEHKHVRTQ